ncbi:MAG: ATP-binding cassette domain-containing protein, partial [Bacteroidota bacterium]
MNYLNAENIAKSYGERMLFQNISFSIHKDDKIAFVAKNGSGKTNILNIISGQLAPDEGQVVLRKGIKLAVLDQEPILDPKLSIEESILSADLPIHSVIRAYEKALEKPADI